MHNKLGFNTSITSTNFGAGFIDETKKKLSSLGNNPKVGRIALGAVALLAVAGGGGYVAKTLWNGQSQPGGFNSTQTNTTGNFTLPTQTNTTLGNLTSVNTTNVQGNTTNSSYNQNSFFFDKDLDSTVANFTNTSIVNETECKAGLIAGNTTKSDVSTANSSYTPNPFFSVKDLKSNVANFTNTSVVNETDCLNSLALNGTEEVLVVEKTNNMFTVGTSVDSNDQSTQGFKTVGVPLIDFVGSVAASSVQKAKDAWTTITSIDLPGYGLGPSQEFLKNKAREEQREKYILENF